MNAAKKMTLDEIKALPKASIVWLEVQYESDDGIKFYSLDPVMVCVPGEDGCLIGGDKHCFINRDIDDQLLDDATTIWSMEPDREQLEGMSAAEYDALIC